MTYFSNYPNIHFVHTLMTFCSVLFILPRQKDQAADTRASDDKLTAADD